MGKSGARDAIVSLGMVVAQRTGHASTAATAVKMGLELHGYLQASLQGCGLDRVLMPHAQSNGFEVWRLLHGMFKPHTALNALTGLREVVFGANLFSGDILLSEAPRLGAHVRRVH